MKKHPIRSVLSSIFFLGIVSMSMLNAQTQQPSHREIGLRLTSLDNFGMVYKKGIRKDRYIRHTLGLVNISTSGNGDSRVWNLGLGYAFGLEKRKPVIEKLKFIHGFEPRVGVSYSFLDNRANSGNLQVGLGYVLGFHYNFTDVFYINIEAIPSVVLVRNKREDNDATYAFNAGFNSNAIAVTVACKF